MVKIVAKLGKFFFVEMKEIIQFQLYFGFCTGLLAIFTLIRRVECLNFIFTV